ncbi:putative bifunctional diguanylate cyclase/phosphodiesterase [Blastococcus haudaquaticus]|uniref:PAS domain S-box-containing protein/diguanylate cyclase (GGDEF) domain-containing protein n=1 Tax=Blastococcus haudaquaticus TaxID=1938745 RepID=A0A286GC78_9ACTN|nr:GGDEF domain-containing phosphodiesterase [Blastococcus haudaquaticus]SOD93111.1 PAS domain S-box-containing protein/diguanylate cyclase (GGDEF) domain-containing protein [Blastococcus haudaquaticus]
MDSRRWWLLAAAVPVALGCLVAAVEPALRAVGEVAVVAAGLMASAVLWTSASRTARPRAWRLFAVAPLLPATGALVALVAAPVEPVQLAVYRWLPTVPGYVIAIIAILSLVDCRRLRVRPRVAVEVALFLFASLIMVSLLVVGPAGRWAELAMDERVVLGAAVVTTSATMAAALTALGLAEPSRRRMVVVLLAGTALLTAGRGLGTSAMLSGASVPLIAARFSVSTGLFLLALAVLLDTRQVGADSAGQGRWSFDLAQVLPHLALLSAVATVGGVALTGGRPTEGMIVGLFFCVVLTAVHRWLTAREEQQLAARLRRSEAYFRSVVRSAGDAVVVLDDALRISWASPALDRALGDAAGSLVGTELLTAVHPDDVPGLRAALPVDGGAPVPVPAGSGLLTLRLPDGAGEWHYLEAGVSDLRRDADVGAVVLHCRDMTERHAREQALQAIAYTDPMTGLPNNAGILRALQGEVSGSPGEPATLLLIELIGLNAARDNAGRETVSSAVAEVGRRLRATVRGEDTVARMGGGAFAVLAHGDDGDADRLAHRCLAVVEQPIATSAGILELTAAVGLAGMDPGAGVDVVLERADLAVRAAHEAGPGSARRYDAALGDAAARRTRLRHDLQGAAARGELFLVFQPTVSLEEQRVTGVEAQLRWRHGTLGEISPSEFAPVAERAGLIGELVRWSLEAAAVAAVGMPECGKPLQLGIKVPAGYLAGGSVVTDVEAALLRSGLAPERLVLEIDAPAVMSDGERLGQDVASLRLMGVHVALYGFGSGSSALANLTRLPIDIVKLDRSLITRIDRDPQSRALCESVIGIGRALGLHTVAEGVETAAQLAALTAFGCGFAQGFVIARPAPLTQFVESLADGDGVLLPGSAGTR